MKRFLALFFAAVLLFCAIACNNSSDSQDGNATSENGSSADDNSSQTPTENGTTAEQTTASTTTAHTTSPEDVPAVPAEQFYVGYARVDITPDFSVPISANMTTGAADKIYATVIAFSDGENKALLITTDLRNSKGAVLTKTYQKAEKYGVPRENVFLSATHNHSAITYDDSGAGAVVRWRNLYYSAIDEGIKTALEDLKPATAEIGRAYTEGFAFVRRYIMQDGSFKGIHTNNPSNAYKEHETEADDEMQVIRFNREGAKPVIMVNWQAHPAHAVDLYPTIITSDFVHFFRKGAEEQFDCNFAFFQGGSGNINLHSYISGKKQFANYMRMGEALPGKLGEALENMEPISLGKIQTERVDFDVEVNHADDHLYDIALEVYREKDVAKQKELIKKYGFQSKYEASSIITRHNYGETESFSLTAISFGDLGFASAPYEMFDTNAKEVKDGSKFKMTFVCSCTNGSWSYLAADHAYDNGGYEVYNCKFVRGSAEALANELIRLLNKQFDAK